jgi:hypothetical protein
LQDLVLLVVAFGPLIILVVLCFVPRPPAGRAFGL